MPGRDPIPVGTADLADLYAATDREERAGIVAGIVAASFRGYYVVP